MIIPNIWKTKKMFQTTNQIYIYVYIYRMGPGVIQQYLEVQFQLYVDI